MTALSPKRRIFNKRLVNVVKMTQEEQVPEKLTVSFRLAMANKNDELIRMLVVRLNMLSWSTYSRSSHGVKCMLCRRKWRLVKEIKNYYGEEK